MAKTSLDVTMKKEQLQREISKLEVYEYLRNKMMDEINWRWMEYHEADEEHNNETWFTMPNEDSYKYNDAQIAMEIVTKLDEIILK